MKIKLLLVMAICFLMAGCEESVNTDAASDSTVTSLDLTGLLDAPVEDEAPQTELEDEQYTGAVRWLDEAGTDFTGAVFGGEAYTAEITLTARSGWTFNGVEENSFTYAGAEEISNPPDSGTVTVSFPAGYFLPVATADQLAKIGVDSSWPLSGVYRLTADITVSGWTPIGTEAAPFTGRFRGQDNTITIAGFALDVLKAEYIGLFGYISGGKVEDLNFEIQLSTATTLTNDSASTTHRVGALAGLAIRSEFSDIKSSGNLNLRKNDTGGIIVGGIIGVMERSVIRGGVSTVNLTIQPTGTSSPIGQVGGITGSAGLTEIHNCHYAGAINLLSGGAADAGGIAGGLSDHRANAGTKAPEKTIIAECSSSGTMQVRSAYSQYAGGIVGKVAGSRYNPSLIARSRSDMTINMPMEQVGGSMSTPRGTAGGIAAQAGSYSTIQDCYSTGDVLATTSMWSISGAGGIAGSGNNIVSCYSTGTVKAQASQAYGSYWGNPPVTSNAGGIAGIGGTIERCAALNDEIIMGKLAADNLRPRRIAASATGALTNNAGNSAVTWTISKYNDETIVPALETTADGLDGADCPAKPDFSFFTDTLGWDTKVWKVGSNGYPALVWED